MALLRRCARLFWVRIRFMRLREQEQNLFTNKSLLGNKNFLYHIQSQIRLNSQHESHNGEGEPTSNLPLNLKTTDKKESLESSFSSNESGLCYADVKKIIDQESEKKFSQEWTGLSLLESCRDMLPDADLTARLELVRQTWNLIENCNHPLTIEHYKILLSIYAQNAQYLNADEFLRNMKVTPDKDTYQLLLDAVAEIGDYNQALTILTKIKDMGYPVDEAMFNSLILAHSANADIEGAKAIMVTMKAAMIEPSSATYCALARGFAVKGDLDNLMRILKVGNLNEKQLMLIVKSLIIFGHSKHVSDVMKYLPKTANIKTSEIIYNIIDLTYLGKATGALEIINCLQITDKELASASGFADFFLYQIVKADTPIKEIIEICESLISSKKNLSALLKTTEAALRLKKEDIALSTFQAMRNHGIEIRPHFYWPLLVNAALNKSESDVIKLVKHMIDNQVYLDSETLQDYIIPFMSVLEPVMIVRKLQDCGIKISEIFTPLLTTLLSKGDLSKAVALTDRIKGKPHLNTVVEYLVIGYELTRNADATAELLKNIRSNSNENGKFFIDLLASQRITVTNEELSFLIFAFHKNKVNISKVSADILKSRMSQFKSTKHLLETIERLIDPKNDSTDATSFWGTLVPHPRSMTPQELENHLVDLSANSMNTRGVLRKLVQVYCRKSDLQKAEQFAEIFNEKGFEWSTGMVSSMFSLYVAKNMPDEAELWYKQLKESQKKFKIDEHKIIDYATLLIKNKKLKKALEVLQENDVVYSGPETIRNCWRLLNAVAADGNSMNTKETLDVLLNKGYCEINNHILGPLIRSYLTSGDLESAVRQFKECALVYKKVPLAQELVRALVEASPQNPEAQKQLEEILAIIKDIYGSTQADSHLLMALAVMNRPKELHKFITMMTRNQITLNISVQKLADEMNLAALQTILKVCKGLKTFDVTIIYELILNVCSRSGDSKTALEIWNNMRTEEVIPSPRFIENLKNLLELQKISLPPDLISRQRRVDR